MDQDQITKNYQEAVAELIEENHKLGLPVYQIEDGYIIGLFPNNIKKKLQKVRPLDFDNLKRYAKFEDAFYKDYFRT